jgi:iron complex outermembrane receptor protein
MGVTWFCLALLANSQTGTQAPRSEVILKRLSLQQLTEVHVISVSRREERATDAAAAISVITAEDIRRSGATNLVEALRMANGVAVARGSGSSWAVSARGFNISSANKMQVMIDGRNAYSPLFAGTFWDVQGVLLEDVDRIEVIRGPGATLWGTNAVNGVINIITKAAPATQGGLLAGAAGTETNFGAVRWGGRAGDQGYYRFYTNYIHLGDLAFSDGTSARDPMQRGFMGFRSDWTLQNSDQVTVQGDLYRMNADRLAADDINARGGNLVARWTRQLAGQAMIQVQGYYDRTSRDLPPSLFEVRNTYDVEMQHHVMAGERNNLVWGLGYRASADETRTVSTVSFEPPERTLHWFSAFGQDEIALVADRLHLVFGSKLEHNSYTGLEVQPTARLAWTHASRNVLWGAISRALRTPTRLDADLRIRTATGGLFGNPDQESEELIAYEGGYRIPAAESFLFGVSGYYNRYDHIRSVETPVAPGAPLTEGNTLEGYTYGGEATSTVQLRPWWQARISYSHLQLRLKRSAGSRAINAGTSEANDPRNQASFRSYMDLPRNVELDFWVRHVSGLPVAAANQPRVPGYVTFDVRMGWRPVADLELSVVGQNLPDEHHAEFPADGPPKEVQRGVYGKVVWTF